MSDVPPPPASAPRITGGDAVASEKGEVGTKAKDLVFVGGRTDDGGFRVLRSRENRLEVGEMRAPREGQPLMGELVKLEPSEEHEQLFECETLVESPVRTKAGPPQVASEAYRSGWERIFGGDGEDPSALN
ncbi:MAG TPA: hypothetical protein ENK57_02720 [Polyangiaceae bacterium]|nr:hypothetical protein [Polyangiaceae bacterium]